MAHILVEDIITSLTPSTLSIFDLFQVNMGKISDESQRLAKVRLKIVCPFNQPTSVELCGTAGDAERDRNNDNKVSLIRPDVRHGSHELFSCAARKF